MSDSDWSYVYYKPVALVWVTALTGKYAGQLLEELVKKGYSVSSSSLDGNLSVTLEGSVSSIISISLSNDNIEMNASFIMKEVRECLYNIKALYYSLVAMVATDVAWGPGNIIIQYRAVPPPVPSKPKNHLRVVKSESPSNKNPA